HAIGVNFADTRFRQGTYTVKPKLPDSPGMAVAGVIEARGAAVANLRPGLRVAALTSRAYAEDCVPPALLVVALPDPGGLGDRGVDLILDAVGKPTFEEGLRCLAAFGHIILYGRAGGAPDPLNLSALSPKSQKVSAFSLPTLTRGFPDKTREGSERCFALMRE